MYVSTPFTSLNDFPNEVSLFLPLEICHHSCPFCFNKELREPKHEVDNEEIKQKIKEDRGFITAIMFGGSDIILQLDDCLDVAKYAKDLDLKVGMQVSKLGAFETIDIIKSGVIDYISVTINSFLTPDEWLRLSKLSRTDTYLEIKVIHIPQKVDLGNFLQGLKYDCLVVQQFQNKNCLDEDYQSIRQPNRDEVLEFAKSIGADFIITKEGGRENVETKINNQTVGKIP